MKRYSPILLLTLCIAIGSPPAAGRGEQLSSRQALRSTLAPRSIAPMLLAQAESSDTPPDDTKPSSEKPSEKPSEKGSSSDKKSSQTTSSTGKTNSEKSSATQWKKTLWWVGLGTTGVAAIAFLYFLFRLSRPQPAVQSIGPQFSPALPEDEPELELDSPAIPTRSDRRSLSLVSQDSSTQDSSIKDSDTQGSSTQDSSTQDSSTQDSSTQDSSAKDSSTQDSSAKDSSTQDSSIKDSDLKSRQNAPVSDSQAVKPPIPETPPEPPKEPKIAPISVAEAAPPEPLQLERTQAEPKPVAIEETVPMRRINIVDALIQDLHNPDPNKRRKAIWELGQRGDSRAIQPLVDLMLDSDSSQRSLILGVLAEIGTRTVKPMNRALAVSLQDDSPEVRKNAIRDLTRIYDSIAQMSQLLNHAIDDDDGEVSETARWALGQLNRIRSLPKRED
jgi:HEAT repeats